MDFSEKILEVADWKLLRGKSQLFSSPSPAKIADVPMSEIGIIIMSQSELLNCVVGIEVLKSTR